MGVKGEPLWEIQWHPGSGGRVRRLLLTRRGLRRGLTAAAAVALLTLVVLAVLPVGVRGLLFGVRVEQTRRENRALRMQGEELREEARAAAERLAGQLNRARRLAWVMGAPEEVWRPAVPQPPAPDSSDEAVIGGLVAGVGRLETMERVLLVEGLEPPCGLASLPTFPPLAPSRAVVVDVFGWRVSPFTGKEEAHHGLTLAAPRGETVRAPGNGTVAFAGTVRERRSNEWTRYGNVVVLSHGGGVFTVFGHLDSVAVRRGQAVARGAVVGTVGTTGWIRVPALYFEIRWPWRGSSRPLDPALFQLAFAVRDLDERLQSPDGGLPDDQASLESLPGFRG